MNSRDLDFEVFFARLLAEVPEFKPVYEDQLEYHEELLSTLMLAELGRFLIAAYRRVMDKTDEGGQTLDLCTRIVTIVEEAMSSADDDLVTAVCTGFVEALPVPGDDEYEGVKSLLGSRVGEALAAWLRGPA